MILLTSIGEFLKRMTKIDQNEISLVSKRHISFLNLENSIQCFHIFWRILFQNFFSKIFI